MRSSAPVNDADQCLTCHQKDCCEGVWESVNHHVDAGHYIDAVGQMPRFCEPCGESFRQQMMTLVGS